MDNKDIEEIKPDNEEKVRLWISRYNEKLTLFFVVFVAFVIRLYYFYITKDQALWWDEATYMASAKSYAGLGDYVLESIRLPTLPIIASVFFKIGFTESTIRFFLLFIPSIILIYLTYYLVFEMYEDRKMAVISALLTAVLWENLFYSNRFHTENLAIIFEFLAMIVLIKGYLKEKDLKFIKTKHSIIWMFMFSIISILFRPGNIVFIPGLIFFIVLLKFGHLLKSKRNRYLSLFIGIIILILFFIIMNSSKIPIISIYYHPENKISWISLTIFSGFFQPINNWPNIIYYLFLFGLIISAFNLILNYDQILKLRKDKLNLKFKSDLLNFAIILSVMASFVFFIRPWAYEYRWFFPLLPGMLVFTSRGIVNLSEIIGKGLSNKKITLVMIIVFSLFGFYTQLLHADYIIKIKVDSYRQVKESGIWIKEHSNINDLVVSASVPQHSYYSERKIYNFGFNSPEKTENIFNLNLSMLKPRYVVVSVFEPGFTPQWAYEWPNKNQNRSIPVQAYFADPEKKQPLLIIYEMKYD